MVKYWINDGYDVVYTTRKKTSGNNFFLRMLSKVGYFVLARTSNIKVDVDSGDFKLINRKDLLKKNGIVILHRHKNTKEKFANCFKIIDQRVYGVSKITFGQLFPPLS